MQINSATNSSPYTGNPDTPTPRASADTDIDTDAAQTPADAPSSVKEFTYGALGLDSPSKPGADTNQFYTAGKWVAAAATIGGIVSLFV